MQRVAVCGVGGIYIEEADANIMLPHRLIEVTSMWVALRTCTSILAKKQTN
jgi:hypothetical protein